jgi:tetratricopeptide (TPR) repeat protein
VTNQLIEEVDVDTIVMPTLPSTSSSLQHEKNSDQSAYYREKGNTYFKQKELYESLHSYNEAIRTARFAENNLLQENSKTGSRSSMSKNEEELLPLSLANRSAVYYELGENYYERALQDADLALNYGYPDRLKSKLLLRKANIYVKRQEWNLANEILKELEDSSSTAEPSLGKTNLDSMNKVHELSVRIENGKKQHTEMGDKGKNGKDTDAAGSKESTENESFENASPSLTLNFSEKCTRYVTTKKDLKKGEIVFVEEPFASVLLPEFYESHCHFCHRIFEQEYFFPYENTFRRFLSIMQLLLLRWSFGLTWV